MLPIAFEEVRYFRNEYRGDLIVTKGVLYYFPHTRVRHSRFAPELKGSRTVELVGLAGLLYPFAEAVPWLYVAADRSVKLGKLLRRSFYPIKNKPRISREGLWISGESDSLLQQKLDAHIESLKNEPLKFEEDSVPKPVRFQVSEIENLSLKIKLRFDAKFDSHDFRVNPLHRNLLKRALIEAGFLPRR
jgi:hypothetical protein